MLLKQRIAQIEAKLLPAKSMVFGIIFKDKKTGTELDGGWVIFGDPGSCEFRLPDPHEDANIDGDVSIIQPELD